MDRKIVLAIVLAKVWSMIVLAANDQQLLEVIPWLMGAIMPPPGKWW